MGKPRFSSAAGYEAGDGDEWGDVDRIPHRSMYGRVIRSVLRNHGREGADFIMPGFIAGGPVTPVWVQETGW